MSKLKVGDTVKVVDSSYPNRVGDVGRVCELEDGIAYLRFGTKSGYWIAQDFLEIYVPEPTLSTQPNWNSPTIAEVESIVTNMPGGLDGFLKGWGWLQFAREVEKLCQEKNS